MLSKDATHRVCGQSYGTASPFTLATTAQVASSRVKATRVRQYLPRHQLQPSGPISGVVTISTPNSNNTPAPYGCTVVDEGAGQSGAILVGVGPSAELTNVSLSGAQSD
jgi:hypothetical protein